MIRVLFVCHGNICRSPMAEFVMKDLVKKAGEGQHVFIASAAVSREETGNPVHPGTRAMLRRHGLSCDGKYAVTIAKGDYDRYDWLVGMDRSNITRMHTLFGGDPEGKICRLLDFTDHPRDVADPWYTGDFESTWRDVVEGCTAMLQKILEEPKV